MCFQYYTSGDSRNSTGILPTDKKFTGQRLDSTGLYYYNARYYDATIGRFISPDTVVPNPANPQSLNRYSYCHNNPLAFTDPTGHNEYYNYHARRAAEYQVTTWIYVCGTGQSINDASTFSNARTYLNSTFPVGKNDNIVIIADNDSGDINVDPRMLQLRNAIESCGSKTINLVGYSEGAATVATYLGDADNVSDKINAGVMLERPNWPNLPGLNLGTPWKNVPQELINAGRPDIKIADIWNSASLVHNAGIYADWGSNYSHPYDSRSALEIRQDEGIFGNIHNWESTGKYHGDIIQPGNQHVKDAVYALFQ